MAVKHFPNQPPKTVVDTKIVSVNGKSLTFPGNDAYSVRKIAGTVFWKCDSEVREVTEEGFSVDHGTKGGDFVLDGNGKVIISRAEEDAKPYPVHEPKKAEPKPRIVSTRKR